MRSIATFHCTVPSIEVRVVVGLVKVVVSAVSTFTTTLTVIYRNVPRVIKCPCADDGRLREKRPHAKSTRFDIGRSLSLSAAINRRIINGRPKVIDVVDMDVEEGADRCGVSFGSVVDGVDDVDQCELLISAFSRWWRCRR